MRSNYDFFKQKRRCLKIKVIATIATVLLLILFYKLVFFLAFVGVGLYLLYSIFRGYRRSKSKIYKFGIGFLSLVLISSGIKIAGINNKPTSNNKTEVEENFKLAKNNKKIENKQKFTKEDNIDKRKPFNDNDEKLEDLSKNKDENNKAHVDKSEKKSSETNTNIVSKESNTSSKNIDSHSTQLRAEEVKDSKPEPLRNNQNVYITKTGSKYHKGKCGKGNFFEINLKEAQSRGLEPCSKCY